MIKPILTTLVAGCFVLVLLGMSAAAFTKVTQAAFNSPRAHLPTIANDMKADRLLNSLHTGAPARNTELDRLLGIRYNPSATPAAAQRSAEADRLLGIKPPASSPNASLLIPDPVPAATPFNPLEGMPAWRIAEPHNSDHPNVRPRTP